MSNREKITQIADQIIRLMPGCAFILIATESSIEENGSIQGAVCESCSNLKPSSRLAVLQSMIASLRESPDEELILTQ